MAPTICMAELTANDNNKNNNRTSSNYTRHRQRNAKNSNVIMKEEKRRVELKRIFNNPTNHQYNAVHSLTPPASPVWEPTCPTNSFLHNRNSISYSDNIAESTESGNLNCNQRWRAILARRDGLLDIVARTMALVRRSHMLQKRVNALRYETREFIRSVLNNPENNKAGKELIDVNSRGILSMDVSSSSSSSSSYFEVISSRPITPPPTPDSSTEYIHINDYDDSNSNSSDYSSEDNSDHMSDGEVDQDPMVSSS